MPKFPFLSLKLFGMVLIGLGLFQIAETLIEPRYSLLFLALSALLLLLPGFFPSLRKSYNQLSAYSILAFVCIAWISILFASCTEAFTIRPISRANKPQTRSWCGLTNIRSKSAKATR